MSRMSRSLKVKATSIKYVRLVLRQQGYNRQEDFADVLSLSRGTVNKFFTGRPIDCSNFHDICVHLEIDWKEIADFSEDEDFTYIQRPPIEDICYQTILQPGYPLRIKACKKMGKTTLINKILAEAVKQNYRTVSLSLLLTDEVVSQGLYEFLRCFCLVVGRKLNLTNQLDDYWESDLGSCYNCTIYFEEYLLSYIKSPLVLALDDVDQIFSLPFAGDVLKMLRAWCEKAQINPLWQKIRLILSYSSEIYIPLDINHSPFSIGRLIELPEFSVEQVEELVKRQGLDWDNSQLQQLISLVGGHPYLIQKAVNCLKNQPITFEEFLREAPKESGIYSSHLRSHFLILKEHPELAGAMSNVVQTTQPVQIETLQAFKLQSLGLIIQEDNYVKPRCRLYAQYLQERL